MPAWQFDLTDRATDELTEIWMASSQRSVRGIYSPPGWA